MSSLFRLFCNLLNDRAARTHIFFRQNLFRVKNRDKQKKYYIVSSLLIFFYIKTFINIAKIRNRKLSIRKKFKNSLFLGGLLSLLLSHNWEVVKKNLACTKVLVKKNLIFFRRIFLVKLAFFCYVLQSFIFSITLKVKFVLQPRYTWDGKERPSWFGKGQVRSSPKHMFFQPKYFCATDVKRKKKCVKIVKTNNKKFCNIFW